MTIFSSINATILISPPQFAPRRKCGFNRGCSCGHTSGHIRGGKLVNRRPDYRTPEAILFLVSLRIYFLKVIEVFPDDTEKWRGFRISRLFSSLRKMQK
jgi:hypothetical protein